MRKSEFFCDVCTKQIRDSEPCVRLQLTPMGGVESKFNFNGFKDICVPCFRKKLENIFQL